MQYYFTLPTPISGTAQVSFDDIPDAPWLEDTGIDHFGDNLDDIFLSDQSFTYSQVSDPLETSTSTPDEQSKSVSPGFPRRTLSSPLLPFPQQQMVSNLPIAQSAFCGFQFPFCHHLRIGHEHPKQPQIDKEFTNALEDQSLTVNPASAGFIPSKLWTNEPLTFGVLVCTFFQRKNNSNSRFPHKLYNAVKLSELGGKFPDLVGVRWMNDFVLRVDKRPFARLIGLKSVDGSLFHQQGNFPSHGFVEISQEEVQEICPDVDTKGIDFDNQRLIMHSTRQFVRDSTEESIEACRWTVLKKSYPELVAAPSI